MRGLGLDVGDKRIGVALSDPEGILASPLTAINRKEEKLDIKAITDLISQHEVAFIVVGLPRSLDGSVGWQVSRVRDFVDKLSRRIRVPIYYRDERLTTVMAQRLKRISGRKGGRGKKSEDAQAAALILQNYLDEER
jgi:putative Holliday junction resolvase